MDLVKGISKNLPFPFFCRRLRIFRGRGIKGEVELLKVLNYLKEEAELAEIKSLLIAYLSDKVVRSADKAFDEKNDTTMIFEKWKLEHFRKSA